MPGGTGGGGSDDKKVKISSADTTPNFLENKIVAGNAIVITKLNTGANEQLEIAVSDELDGGAAASVYLTSQIFNGGGA